MTTGAIEPTRSEAPHGVRWLILVRLAVILLCVAVLIVRSRPEFRLEFQPLGVYVLLGGLAVLDIAYLLVLPFVRRALTAFLFAQFLIDIAAETGLIFFTGGLDSNFVNVYFVSIVAASLLLGRRNSALFASLATVGLATVTALYILNAGLGVVDPIYRPATPLTMEDVWHALSWMLLITVAFFVVAYLSGVLAERVELARSLNEEILQNMAEGVAVFDPRGGIIFLNPEFERLFSPRRPIQLGDSVESVFSAAGDDKLRRVVTSGTTARFELLEREEEPRRPPIEMRTSPLGAGGTRRSVVVLAIDLSLRRRAELAERRAERFSAVSEMAAGLAHEIRNPLASVRGSVQEISREFAPESENQRLAEIVIKESDRLNNIITSFLRFARQRPLHPTECRLGKLLAEIAALLEQREDARGVAIALDVAADPPVRCDPEQMREVFLNLGVNGLTALAGAGRLTIRCPHPNPPPPDTTTILRRNGREEGIAVSFTDTGAGLPPGAEDRIFEPFYTTKPQGSGLGLALARRVVESHEGRIWVKSKPGEGAAFYIWLPRSGPFTPGAPLLEEEA